MEKIGRMYRSGIWKVRAGKIEEFISVWQTSVDWLIAQHPMGWVGEAVLLQDIDNSHKFISFAWSSMPGRTEEILSGIEYQPFMVKMRQLCEEIQPHRMRVAAYAVSKNL